MVGRAIADRRQPCVEPHGVDGARPSRYLEPHTLGHGAQGLLPSPADRRSLRRPALLVRRRRFLASLYWRAHSPGAWRSGAAAAVARPNRDDRASSRRAAGRRRPSRDRDHGRLGGHAGRRRGQRRRRWLPERDERSRRYRFAATSSGAGRDRVSMLRRDHASRRAYPGGRRFGRLARRASWPQCRGGLDACGSEHSRAPGADLPAAFAGRTGAALGYRGARFVCRPGLLDGRERTRALGPRGRRLFRPPAGRRARSLVRP